VAPRIGEILAHVDRFPYGQLLPPQEEALFRIALALTEVTPAVEVYRQPEVPFVPKPHVVDIVWNNGVRRDAEAAP
jgi:hypothetical protein